MKWNRTLNISVQFKQRAVIVFLTAESVFQSKFTYVCNFFTLRTVLTRALRVVIGPTDVKMTSCVVWFVWQNLDNLWQQPLRVPQETSSWIDYRNLADHSDRNCCQMCHITRTCVTLFIFVDIGRFMHDGLSHDHGGFAEFWIQVTLTNTSSVKYCVMNNTQHLSETLVSTQARHKWRLNYRIVYNSISTEW
jgi:hypothetical protein